MRIKEKDKQSDPYKDYIGKKYHAWKDEICGGYITTQYLGIVKYIKRTGNIVYPFYVRLNNGNVEVASTIDLFSTPEEIPFLWLK